MADILEVEDLSFAYAGGSLFSGVGFSLGRGDFVALTGANGSGKSTLLKLILGELAPLSGRIALFGQAPRGIKDFSMVGYLPQNDSSGLGFPATALEIVSLSLYSSLKFPKFITAAVRAQALEALRLAGMEDYAQVPLSEMSGGQRQRVYLARTLIHTPKLMLLDEPATGVDAEHVTSLYTLLKKLTQETGLCVLMVTHDVARAAGFVDYALCLEQGSLVKLDRGALEHELAHRHTHPTGGETYEHP